MVNGGWRAYYGLENNCKLTPLLFFMDVKFGATTSLKYHGVQHFVIITYNHKIKGNTHYHILLIEVSLSPIESMAMTRYLMYKNKVNTMGDNRLHKNTSYFSQNQLRLEKG